MGILSFLNPPKKNEPEFVLLVVDDSQDILEMLAMAEYPEKMEVKFADNAFKAIEILKTERVDAVLADINMPNQESLNKYLKLASQDLPVFRMSGQYERFLNLQLKKPFEMREYYSVVKMLYGLSRQIRKAG